jgi:hypothetical protein
MLLFTCEVLAVTIAYGALLGSFAGELCTFKAQLYTFGVGAVTDFAELVLSSNTADAAIWARAFLHFGAFFAADSTDADFHFFKPQGLGSGSII